LFNKGDFEGMAKLYAADATAFPPGSPMVKGRPAIGKMWKGMAEQVGNPRLTVLDIKRLSPTAAREIGTFTLTTKGPSPKEISGKYLVLWEKVWEGWKISADIWNDGK
jgi:ketosteroid isomerase-like protein